MEKFFGYGGVDFITSSYNYDNSLQPSGTQKNPACIASFMVPWRVGSGTTTKNAIHVAFSVTDSAS